MDANKIPKFLGDKMDEVNAKILEYLTSNGMLTSIWVGRLITTFVALIIILISIKFANRLQPLVKFVLWAIAILIILSVVFATFL